jgi:hypothetical protein
MSQLPDPVSSRQAFASAFRLALRRDPLQSLFVPFLLRAPWAVAAALIFAPGGSAASGGIGIWWLATLGGVLVGYIVEAMLMLRARSVADAAPGGAPAPALECYASGLKRVPWLIVTDLVRAALVLAGLVFLIVPGFFAMFRLAFATQAVVLSNDSLAAGFRRSSRLTARRLDRWLEMAGLTLVLVVPLWVVYRVTVSLLHVEGSASFAALPVMMVAVEPVLIYAWTFFFLQLMALDAPGVEVGPLYAAAPPTHPVSTPPAQPIAPTPWTRPPLPPPPAPPPPLA